MASNYNLHKEDTKTPIELAHQLEASLPRVKWCITPYIYFYQNFWCPSNTLANVIALQVEFEAQDTDILLASKPKSGTTWLKALAFTVLHRHNHSLANHPLLSANPHDLVPFLEYSPPEKVLKLNTPRLFSTHLPYQALPKSIRSDYRGCRVVYLFRNPFDTVVSFLKFKEIIPEMEGGPLKLEEYVDSFCKGVEWYGPYWDHVLGYWNASLENPDKVLFLKYEDMKTNGVDVIKRLAEFLRVPFTTEEEDNGTITATLKLCSFENLKDLEVNRNGNSVAYDRIKNKVFFRNGSVGDWKNHITPMLFDRLNKVIEDKFCGTGLSFKVSI